MKKKNCCKPAFLKFELQTERPLARVGIDVRIEIVAAAGLRVEAVVTGDRLRICSKHGRFPGVLEPGETQTVETMIKCISVASANDACVAMAEHVAVPETCLF